MSKQNSDSNGSVPSGKLGVGAEAAEGVHSAQQSNREPQATSSLEGREAASTNKSDDRDGSEPLMGREQEHKPSYGGEGGKPRTSSDTRESNSEG